MQYQKRLDEAERRFEELTAQMADPAIINDPAQYRKIAKAQNDLAEVVGKYREWKTAHQQLAEARVMLNESDPDLQAMAQDEVLQLEPRLRAIGRGPEGPAAAQRSQRR